VVQTTKAMEENAASAKPKPEAVIEKMIAGRMAKYFEEVTLLGQKFAMNSDITVAQAAKDAGVEVVGFVRMAVGEGIEKVAEDFAAEVASMLKS
jgi:elongation factor Ts